MSAPTADSTGNKRGRGRGVSLLLNHGILLLLVVFAMGPLVILAFNSLKTQAEIGRNPLGFPESFVWRNFPDAWEIGRFSATMGNSAMLVAMTVSGVLLLGGMAAYSLAKLDLPGS